MKDLNRNIRNLAKIIALSLLFMGMYAMNRGWDNFTMVFGLGILLSAATFAFGGVFGFLFGLPSYSRENDNIGYERNASLKEISDWLTKIIIGLTLVQLKDIIDFFIHMIKKFSEYMDVGDSGIIYCGAIMVEFFAIGFVSIYLFTITDLLRYLVHNERNLSQTLTDLAEGKDFGKFDQSIEKILKDKTANDMTEKEKSKVAELYKDLDKISDINALEKLSKLMMYSN